MNQIAQELIQQFQTVLSGAPWYGKPIYEILQEAQASPQRDRAEGHSMLDLIRHMNLWADYALIVLRKEGLESALALEAKDWQPAGDQWIDWDGCLARLKASNEDICKLLEGKEDAFFLEKLPNKDDDFRFLLQGLIQHHIYHAGQIAYLSKWPLDA